MISHKDLDDVRVQNIRSIGEVEVVSRERVEIINRAEPARTWRLDTSGRMIICCVEVV